MESPWEATDYIARNHPKLLEQYFDHFDKPHNAHNAHNRQEADVRRKLPRLHEARMFRSVQSPFVLLHTPSCQSIVK
jgi:hypothetical protein